MLKAERRAEVEWQGDLIHGNGTIVSVGSGAIGNLPVTWASRTESSDGKTSPEELIAAAHASCFSMSFANELNKVGFPPDKLSATAICTADRVEGRFTIISMDLEVSG